MVWGGRDWVMEDRGHHSGSLLWFVLTPLLSQKITVEQQAFEKLQEITKKNKAATTILYILFKHPNILLQYNFLNIKILLVSISEKQSKKQSHLQIKSLTLLEGLCVAHHISCQNFRQRSSYVEKWESCGCLDQALVIKKKQCNAIFQVSLHDLLVFVISVLNDSQLQLHQILVQFVKFLKL